MKTVQKGPLQHENNTETFRIICSNRFEVLATTDNDDDDNDSKLGKSEKIMSKVFLRNDDVKNGKKKQVSCIPTDNTKTTHYPRTTTNRQTIIDVKVFIKVVSRTNKIVRDHQENYLNINKVTSTCYKFVRNCAINRQYPENIIYK